jgi:hypothetical protein
MTNKSNGYFKWRLTLMGININEYFTWRLRLMGISHEVYV